MESNEEYRDYEGFKGCFRSMFPAAHYRVETFLEGQLEREVFRSNDKSNALQVEVLFLPENGSYSQLLQIRLKHPKSPALNRLQNAFLISPIELGTGLFNEANVQHIQRQLQALFAQGWQEVQYFKGKEHFTSIIRWPNGKKWHYRLDTQALKINSSPFDWIYPYQYRFWGYKAQVNTIKPKPLSLSI